MPNPRSRMPEVIGKRTHCGRVIRMQKTDPLYCAYTEILKEELVPAMGCTEPIAVAYAAAKARDALGMMPEKVVIGCSGSIIKNVKSVVVPNTGGMKGLEAAAAAGIVAGNAERKLEVISAVREDDHGRIRGYLKTAQLQVEHLSTDRVFEILITVYAGRDTAKVHIVDTHTNIIEIQRNGEVLFEAQTIGCGSDDGLDHTVLNVADIFDYCSTVDLNDIRSTLERQIDYNMAIAQEGLKHDYGANIGKTLLRFNGEDNAPLSIKARALAAAGSDARMCGCSMPVVINSGSGNQGITASVPVVVWARETHVSEEKMLRALALSNLVAIHQKTYIGTLSAFCGAVSAGIGAGAGIAYLMGGDLKTVAHTISNALAIISGMVCDGAKSSCAAKISQAVEVGLFGWEMYQNGQQFRAGDGLVVKGVDENVKTVGRLGRKGMNETNREIIEMMIGH